MICKNARCGARLGVDHVTLITTTHVRRFCSVECIAEGQEAARAAVRTPSAIRGMSEEQVNTMMEQGIRIPQFGEWQLDDKLAIRENDK